MQILSNWTVWEENREDEFVSVVYHIVAQWGSPSSLSIILILRPTLFLSTWLQKRYMFSFSFSTVYCLDEKLICFPFLFWRVRPKKGSAIWGDEYKTWVSTEIEMSWIPENLVTCINNTAVGFQILSLPVHSLPACQPKEYGGPTGQLWGHSNEFFGVSCDKIASNQSNTEKTV